MSLGFFEQDGRATRFQHPIADFGHLQMWIDLNCYALQLAPVFELGDEIAQVPVFHRERKTLMSPPEPGNPAQCRQIPLHPPSYCAEKP